jgi:hypothetical protein
MRESMRSTCFKHLFPNGSRQEAKYRIFEIPEEEFKDPSEQEVGKWRRIKKKLNMKRGRRVV